MVLRMICSVGLILLVQNTVIFVEAEMTCRVMEKLVQVSCDSQLHLGSDPSPLQNKCTFNAENDTISLTFYQNFSDPTKEFQVSLLRGLNKTSVCKKSFGATHQPFVCNNFKVTQSASHVTFHLQNPTEDDTDIYYFCIEDMYPPPYICECDEGTIVHIKKHKKIKEVIEIQKLPLSLLIILGCIAAYSLIITTSFVYILTNRRRTRIQRSEYINVAQRAKNHKPYMPYIASSVYPVTR
ncbi:hypothetical protein GDO81_017156 [Engystomops pustulosus]|uniref:Inducible T-cell costimulator n=1 Tax=Engystomops pustulosus TaxID=76066 RepID=A0AAV7AF99_ENGPU|nr:hypothetical protein GDO81_017156 [Engystomops pustulosus]